MASSALDNMPDISIMDEEGITLEGIQNDMLDDYESRYKELTGEDITLYPADTDRIKLNVVAGQIYQLYVIMNENYRMNFLKYMYGDRLKNWLANFGFTESGIKSAGVVLRFHLAGKLDYAVGIPSGTRATSGDNVYFATDEYAEIEPGEEYVDVMATCTEEGSGGNEYQIGRINTLADPVNMVSSVENISVSDGGRDEYTDEELREIALNFPSTFSTAGPEDAYIQLVKEYSSKIISVRVLSTDEAVVRICIMCEDGEVPDEAYCALVEEYIKDAKRTPDTDKVEIVAPEVVSYQIQGTYYIAESSKEIAEMIAENVIDAADTFASETQSNIGTDINTDTLVAYALAAGAKRIQLDEPGYTVIESGQVAVCQGISLKYGGLEDD